MRFIDLFAGVGGFHYGIERAYRQQEPADAGVSDGWDCPVPGFEYARGRQKPDCVYANEWDKYANSVYRRQFGGCDSRDIRTVTADSIPDHDLLCGGFPCQSFSIAGKRGGFNDTRGTLFFDIARILKAKQPRLCLLENVKGLLSHDHGRTFKTILTTLVELGYDCQWQVCNSKDFGVPQNRERIFIVGHLRGTRRPEVFPLTGNGCQVALGPITTGSARNRATGSNYVNEIQSGKVNNGAFVPTKDEALCLDTNYWKGADNHGQRTMIGTLRTHKDGHGFRQMQSGVAPTIPARAREDGSGQGVVSDGYQIRRLTPVECERLQGFPDNWTQFGASGERISDTQRYKMMGNAVTTNVITAISERLLYEEEA